MRIKPKEFYSAMQAQELLGFKNRQVVIKYIKQNSLRAIIVQGRDENGRRYAIKGAWLISFKKRLKSGSVKREKYTKLELKEMLEGTLEYCKQNKISTLKEVVSSINKLPE